MNDYYLIQYREAIRKGEIPAGREMIDELDRLIEDLENPRYYYDTTEAYERMDFMENCIRLTKAPFYNKPMKLMLWQKAFIEVMYSFKMAETGFDRFKKIILLIARKNTKSETCSALGLSELILGEPGNDIVCSSNDDNQASIVYDAIDLMRMLIDPEDLDTKRNQRYILNKATNTKVFKLSDRTRNKEGRNIGCLLQVSPLLHRQAEDGGYWRTRQPLQQEVRPGQVKPETKPRIGVRCGVFCTRRA